MSHVLILLNKWTNYFSLLSLSIRQEFDEMAPLLDLAGISTEFSGTITTQFCFKLFARKRHCYAASATL